MTQERRGDDMRGNYQDIYARSLQDPEGFWAEAAEALAWDRRWDRVLDDARPPFYRWFAGGRLNTCYNAVDRHVEAGRGDQLAVIHDSPVTDSVRTLTYRSCKTKWRVSPGCCGARASATATA